MNTAKLLAATDTSDIAGYLNGSDIEQIRQTVTLPSFVSGFISILLIAASLLSFFFLLFGGIKWITSGGDKDKAVSAQKTMTAALIGLVIAFSVWAIIGVVYSFFGIDAQSPLDVQTVFQRTDSPQIIVDPTPIIIPGYNP